ncbi:MAG: hypothetical protein HFE86_03235 [Clostridiales bacterium]|nr:hypothetical protein [Clostridiales bacterium]
MQAETLMNALVLTKRIGNLLNEIMDISQQLAEAVDRGDEVTAGMLISMRSEPIDKLKVARRALQELVEEAGPADRERLSALLGGGKAADSREEPLEKQAASNARQSEKVVTFERVLNRKVTRDKSIFQ